ncbi:MAG TPA: DUF357 domain-containing protein [archaeon]|nr:DUF357 domain-containing protein [archaeon]
MKSKEDLSKKLKKYRELTKKALEKAHPFPSQGEKELAIAKKLLEMANSYFSDAQYFEKEAKPLTALAAYSYAHAWIDAGVRIGVLDGKGDDKLFTLP